MPNGKAKNQWNGDISLVSLSPIAIALFHNSGSILREKCRRSLEKSLHSELFFKLFFINKVSIPNLSTFSTHIPHTSLNESVLKSFGGLLHFRLSLLHVFSPLPLSAFSLHCTILCNYPVPERSLLVAKDQKVSPFFHSAHFSSPRLSYSLFFELLRTIEENSVLIEPDSTESHQGCFQRLLDLFRG